MAKMSNERVFQVGLLPEHIGIKAWTTLTCARCKGRDFVCREHATTYMAEAVCADCGWKTGWTPEGKSIAILKGWMTAPIKVDQAEDAWQKRVGLLLED